MEREIQERFDRIEVIMAEDCELMKAHALALRSLGDLITKLAAAQLVTEQTFQSLGAKLDSFIAFLRDSKGGYIQ
jgi:hypothetical protein